MTRSLLLALTGFSVGVLPALLPAPAPAADPAYTITAVTRAWFYDGPEDLTDCSNRYSNPLVVDLEATVDNPVVPIDHQVEVKGLQVQIYSGDVLLGTTKPLLAVLVAGEDADNGTFLHLGCRGWGPMMKQGFGGPSADYQVKLVGPGEAYDVNDGAFAGIVNVPEGAEPVKLNQLARTSTLRGVKAGGDVKISTSLQQWADENGRYGWRPAKKVDVVLLKLRRNKYRPVDTVTTSRNGAFTVKFAAGRNNYVKFRIASRTYGSPVYWVKKNGTISSGGR